MGIRIVRTPSSDLGAAAVEYGRQGFPILPCKPHGKTPLISDWPRRATSDLVQISTWWSRWPQANIGIVTGAPGPDVVDIDLRADGDGFWFLEDYGVDGRLVGSYMQIATPSGGQHWWFPGSDQRKTKASHVDFQACGGYVLAPPSRLDIGRYEVIEEFSGPYRQFDWPRATGATAERVRPSRHRRRLGSRGGPAAMLRQARVGERNDMLFRAACWAARSGADPWALAEIAQELGLDMDEVRATINSAIATVGARS